MRVDGWTGVGGGTQKTEEERYSKCQSPISCSPANYPCLLFLIDVLGLRNKRTRVACAGPADNRSPFGHCPPAGTSFDGPLR